MATRKTTRTTPTPTPLAPGDDAAAAGMAVVSGAADADTLDTIENQTRDYIAQRAKRTGPYIDIYVQPIAPPHAVGRIWIRTA
jgi:hypothetical protein